MNVIPDLSVENNPRWVDMPLKINISYELNK